MLRVRHPDVEADATCVDEAQYLAGYAPAGWALVVDEDGTPVEYGETAAGDGDPAPIPAPIVVDLDPAPEESPVSVPEPKPDPSEFVDFDAPTTDPEAIPADTPDVPSDTPDVPSEED